MESADNKKKKFNLFNWLFPSVIAFKVYIQSSVSKTIMSLVHFESSAIKLFNYQTLKF